MHEYTVRISDAEKKALETDMMSIQTWLDNAIHQKARRCMNTIVGQETDKNPVRISSAEKEQLVTSADVKSAKQREKDILGV